MYLQFFNITGTPCNLFELKNMLDLKSNTNLMKKAKKGILGRK